MCSHISGDFLMTAKRLHIPPKDTAVLQLRAWRWRRPNAERLAPGSIQGIA